MQLTKRRVTRIRAFHFFNMEEMETFVTRRVSEGNRLTSLASSGYKICVLSLCEKMKGPVTRIFSVDGHIANVGENLNRR